MNKSLDTLLRVLYGIVDTPEAAYTLLQQALVSDVESIWKQHQAAYQRSCVFCGHMYLVPRTTASQYGFCPEHDTDFNQKELQRVQKQLRRAARSNKAATLTFREWLDTLEEFKFRCAYCRKSVFTDMEHFIPLQKGGGTTAQNVVPSCSYCNWKKRSRDPRKSKNMRISSGDIERIRHYLSKKAVH